MARKAKYETRVIPPLSDGRTPGVCKNCGKQHPLDGTWEAGAGCGAADAVLTVEAKPWPR